MADDWRDEMERAQHRVIQLTVRVKTRLDGIDQKLDSIEGKLDRLDSIEHKLDDLLRRGTNGHA